MAKLKNRHFSSMSPYAGAAPKARLNDQQGIGIGIGILICIFAMLVLLFCDVSFGFALSLSFLSGVSAAVLYWLWPIISFFIKTIRHRRLPDANFLKAFTEPKNIELHRLSFLLR